METYTRDLKTKGTTLDSDASAATRLSQRPSQRRGAAFEDFGSDFGGRSSSRTSQTGTRTSKPGSSSKVAPLEITDGDSEDEIDLLSGSSRHGSESPVKPRKMRKTQATDSTGPSNPIAIDFHQTDPNYKPMDFKKMRIPKKSSAASSSAATPQGSQDSRTACPAGPSTSNAPSLNRTKSAIPSSLDDTKSDPSHSKQKDKSNQPLRERSPNEDRTGPPRWYLPPWEKSDEDDKDSEETPRARPAPRPLYRGAKSKMAKSQTVANMQPSTSQEKSMVERKEAAQAIRHSQSLVDALNAWSRESLSDLSPSTPSTKGKARAQPNEKGNADADRQTTDKGEGREHDPITALFATGSPPRPTLEPKRKKQLSELPLPSPLSSPAASRGTSPPRNTQSRRHRVVHSEDEDGSDAGGRSLRPFPMETRLLEGLKRVSPAKRSSPGSDLEGRDGTYRKRRRRNSPEKAFTLGDADDSDLDDIFLDPSVDPSTLCPWCDEPLPSNPTPHLQSLIKTARRRSYPDDRLTNPLGLRAPPAVFVGVCQRHRFERTWIPRARKRRWPTSIDWGRLKGRIEKMKGELKAIVDDVDEDFAPGVHSAPNGKVGKRPRKENEFWQEVVKNVRQQGSRQTTGVRGQFLHFNKTQPGYYGELGYVIIHQTLCDLFPPASFDPAAALPLTPADFIAHVLVPEAALNLIMEDLNLSQADALKTLRESVEYGVAMFPADEGEGTKGDGDRSILSAGERIVMERARARRKELEEEERLEEEEERRAQERARQTDTEPDVDVDADMDTDADVAPPSSQRAKLKPRPVAKRKPPSSGSEKSAPRRGRSRSKAPETDAGVIELSSDDGGNSDASRTSRASKAKRPRKARHGSPLQRSDAATEAEGATPRPKPKPKPRPRAVGRAALASASQPDLRSSGVLSDPPDEEVLPSSSQSAPCVAWDLKQIRRGQIEPSVDATPRPKPRPVRVTASQTSAGVGGSKENVVANAGPKYPLQLARERRLERAASGTQSQRTHTDGWLPNLRATGDDDLHLTDDDAPDVPPKFGKASTRPQRTASQIKRDESKNSYGWLLDDASSSGSRTSSFGNLD